MKELENKVLAALEGLRPFLQNDGGDIELVEISKNNVVRVKLLGACSSCSMSQMTMKAGVEEAIKRVAPEVTAVEATTEDLFAI